MVEIDEIKLSGVVERAYRRKGKAYFILSIPEVTTCTLDTMRKITIPIANDIYERYRQEIKASQKSDAKAYLLFSGSLELKVEEVPHF